MEIFNMIGIGILGIVCILLFSYYCATRFKVKGLSPDEEAEFNREHLVAGSTWWSLLEVNAGLPDGHSIEHGVTDKVCVIKAIKDGKVLVESFGPITSYEEEFGIEQFIRTWTYIRG